ncbi:MAG: PilZ domain-containing protein [Nannocystis sp.]|nr:PilZ domain-containing protein [Nannocystis sp.]
MGARQAPTSSRFVCDLETTLEVVGRPPVVGLAKDINAAGICVLTEIPVPAGQQINLHLRLVLDGAQSDILTLPARTLWLTRTEGRFQIGAAFAQMPVERWQRLDVILRFLFGEIAFEPT